MRTLLSPRFKDGIVLDSRRLRRPMYQYAIEAGLSPTVLSLMLHDARRVEPGDARIVKIGKRLGLRAAECFASEDTELAS